MRGKKYFSIFLSFVFAFVTVSSAIAMENKNNNQRKFDKSKAMEFYKKSSDLIRENWNDNYFESIKLKVGEDYLIVDNSDKKIKLSSKVYIKNNVIMVPVNEIVNLTGGKITQNNKNININYFGNSIKLKDDSKEIEINDKSEILDGKVNADNKSVVVPIDVLSKGLGYTYKYNKKSKEIELESPYQTMRLIVKLKNSKTDLKKYKSVKILKGLNNIAVLQFKSIEDTKSAYEQIKKDNISVYVEPDYYVHSDGKVKSAPKSGASAYYNSWGVQYMEADKYANYLSKIDSYNSVEVAVIDTGIDYNHYVFNDRINRLGYDFVNDDYYPYDDHGHGTHVSGTIVDCTPDLSINIFPIKVLNYDGKGSTLNVVNGIYYATDNGVDVINLSLGSKSHSDYKHDAINNAILNNVLVVIAAGNSNTYASYECPSDMDEAIVVSAIDSDGYITIFSNYGSTIDVAAPGDYIYSAYPGGGYTYMSGTSMAAPHISAVCAMYRLKYPNLNVYEVEDLVHKNIKDLGSTGWDQYYGYGVPHLSLAIPKEAPEKVQNVKASSKSYNSIKITWNKAAGADGYKIYRATSKSGKYSAIKTVTSASTLSYINTGLTTGKTYYYKVRAYTTINGSKVYGSYSSVVSAKPSLSKPSLYLSAGSKKAYIKWSKISGASGYEIYRASSKKGYYSKIKTITSGKTTSYTNSKLTRKKTYYYKVRAYRYVSGKKVYSSYSSVKYVKVK